jgi:hypothetical protein
MAASVLIVTLALVFLQGEGHLPGDDIASDSDDVHVPCAASGGACGAALQMAIDQAPAGATITLEPGRVYDGTITLRPKLGAGADKRLTITTRGWTSKGTGWAGLVTPADKPRMAVLRGSARARR